MAMPMMTEFATQTKLRVAKMPQPAITITQPLTTTAAAFMLRDATHARVRQMEQGSLSTVIAMTMGIAMMYRPSLVA